MFSQMTNGTVVLSYKCQSLENKFRAFKDGDKTETNVMEFMECSSTCSP